MLPISQEDSLIHEATNYRLLQYSTFEGTCSPYPKRIFSSMRRQIIDYYSTRSLDGTSSLFPKRNSFIHKTTNYSTASVLDLRRDMLPISQEDFLVHEATNYRLLRYSTFGRDKILISQEESIRPSDDRLSTTSVLDLWTGQVPYLPKRNFFSSMRRQLIEYFATQSSDGTRSLSLRN